MEGEIQIFPMCLCQEKLHEVDNSLVATRIRPVFATAAHSGQREKPLCEITTDRSRPGDEAEAVKP